ncbi:MAG TPA: uroporphyrinogen-III C-methyltransferase [Burkholderiaceae bacterium]|nr:uroporphyrinogen-III C-methyltransferase [Burkholderiaceae bacterium]
MTESRTETPQTAQPSASAQKTSAASPSSTKSGGSAVKKKRGGWWVALVIVVLIAVALAIALWYQQRQFHQTSALLSSQAQSSAQAASQASAQAQQAISMVRLQASRVSALQASLQDAQEQVHALGQALQNLTDSGSDLALVNDVDHMVTIANQQLTLNGNVANAIIALESAQSRLARANRPALASLQQTLNGDLDRLRAASVVDVAAVSTQLRQLDGLVGHAALLIPDAAAPRLASSVSSSADAPPTPAEPGAGGTGWRHALNVVRGWWHSAWSSTSNELAHLVSIRRVSDPAALLMSPDQAHQLRENLHMRIMTAQLALMMRQQSVWNAETQALEQALNTRFDTKDPQTRKALELVASLARTQVAAKPPGVENSLQAIEALREAESRRGQAMPSADAASTMSTHSSGNASSGSAASAASSVKPQE